MANIFAQQSGNWSATSTWQGGVLPGPNDVAIANGFTVTVDQDITVQRIRNNLGTTGGFFQITTVGGGVTRNFITTNGITSDDVGANDILLISANGGVINLGSSSIQVFSNFSILRITGRDLEVISTGNISSTNAKALTIDTPTCDVQFNDVSYSGSSFCVQLFASNLTGRRGKITFRNVSNSAAFGGTTISLSGSVDCTVLNVTASLQTNPSSTTISVSNNASLTVLGNVTAGNGTSNAIALNGNAGQSFIDVRGSVTASATRRAIYISNNNGAISSLRVSGPIVNSAFRQAIFSPILDISGGAGVQTSWTLFNTLGNPVVLRSHHTGSPEPSNVRKGVSYGPNNQIVGTMEVPAPQSVSLGVPVDGAVGSAVLSGDDVLNSEIAPGVAIKTRINNIATVSSTGEQLKAALEP
jgi:hypothetical protein